MTSSTPNTTGLVALKKIVECTANCTGQRFFESLAQALAEELGVYGVWVTEYLRKENRLRAIAFWLDGKIIRGYDHDASGPLCASMLDSQEVCHIPDKSVVLFPEQPEMAAAGAVSYTGIALRDTDGTVLGHLSLLDKKPMEEVPEALAIFRILAPRAAAELIRLRSEKLLIAKEARLNRLINGTCEAIVEFDEELRVTQFNNQAMQFFNLTGEAAIGGPLQEFFNLASLQKLLHAVATLELQEGYLNATCLQGQLTCARTPQDTFQAEATLSRYTAGGSVYFALVLRSVGEHFQTQPQLKSPKKEPLLRSPAGADCNLIGRSPALLEAVELSVKVAPTDVAVLVYGETGTGKELIAQLIHTNSLRKHKPLVTLNCAALPSELIESELFGHVKGAFTGAAVAREGRFSLAHNGTIFLDEIGELPLQLQAKLLRVLQEGEFEPVGSSRTRKVNVRVIATTNRDLKQEIEKGTFREDLYYRLNGLPILVPPLRERGEDVILLAEAFIAQSSRRMGTAPMLLDDANKEALRSYLWPGNVRELQHIVERGLIISNDGTLDLRALLSTAAPEHASLQLAEESSHRILTEEEIKDIEIRNILLAMEKAHWKISGKDGAASLLHIPPTTLSSRITKLGIRQRGR